LPAEEIPLRSPAGPYAIVSAGKGYPLLKCNACGENPPLKSNKGISEEIERLSAYLEPPKPIVCPTPGCDNHANGVPVGTPKAYRSYGKTAQGSTRVQCGLCRKVFVVASKPDKGQHETHHNREIFNMLVNKVPLSRIAKMLDISWDVLYHRIGFIHSQCMAFAAHRERRLKSLNVRRLYLSIDAQDYHVNWTGRKDKRNVVLKALTVADNKTGYVLCNALNFDETADRAAIEADAAACGDNLLPPPRRRHARHWLAADYAASVMETAKRAKQRPGATLLEKVSVGYAKTAERLDGEVFDDKMKDEKLPDRGMQIHSEYTMVAVFHLLKGMLGNVGGWRFFMDQESGIRAACLSAFADEIRGRRAEAFYVKIEKELVQEQKRERLAEAKVRFDKVAAEHAKDVPPPTEEGVKLIMIKEEIAEQRRVGNFGDAWVRMPLPTMSEPEKAVCWLTAHDDFLDEDGEIDHCHVAWLHNKASLHGVDTFFMKTRRGMNMCERPITSASNSGRKWSQYQAYDPAILKKALEIFRVYHNFIDLPSHKKGVPKSDRKTPAMRLGLADAPLDFRDVLYFQG
jgi:transposase-like protein